MKTIAILSILFLHLTLSAQEKMLEQPIELKGKNIQFHTVTNSELSCTFVLSFDSIKVFVIESNCKIIQTFTLNRKGVLEKFVGSFIRDDNIYLYMDNGTNPGLHTWLLNITNKTVRENVVPFEIKKDKIINRVSSENHFFYFTIADRTDEFVIYDFIDDTHFDTLRFAADLHRLRNTWEQKPFLNRSSNIEVGNVKREGECDIVIAQNPNKTYVYDDKLFFLSNQNASETNIYEFDLNKGEMNKRSIEHYHKVAKGEPEVFNSFLLNNNLYYVSASQTLFLQVVDFVSGKIVNEFKANIDEEIDFKNTGIFIERGTLLKPREIKETGQLLKRMNKGRAVVSAYHDITTHQVKLLIGAYGVETWGGGSGMMMPGFGGTPGVYVPGVGGGRTNDAIFKLLLDSKTSEHIKGELAPTIYDKIEAYARKMKLSGEGVNLRLKRGNYYYEYYDEGNRTFNILKF